MKHFIYTCDCLLDHLIRLTGEKLELYIMNHNIYSLSDRWMMLLIRKNDFVFFCLKCLNFMRPFMNERILCLKRNVSFEENYDKTCLDFVELSGINNCCQNCLELIYKKLSEVLIKIIK